MMRQKGDWSGGVEERRSRNACAYLFEEENTLGWSNVQTIGKPLSEVCRGTAISRFYFPYRHHGTSHALGERFLGEIECFAHTFDHVSKGEIRFHPDLLALCNRDDHQ